MNSALSLSPELSWSISAHSKRSTDLLTGDLAGFGGFITFSSKNPDVYFFGKFAIS